MNKEELEEHKEYCKKQQLADNRKRKIMSLFIPSKKLTSAFGIFTEIVRDILWQWLIRNPSNIYYIIVQVYWRRFCYFLMAEEYPSYMRNVDKYFNKFMVRDNKRVLTGYRIVT